MTASNAESGISAGRMTGEGRKMAGPGVRGPAPTKPCGTTAAYRRHYKRGESPCAECREANRRYMAERVGVDPAPDLRSVRETREFRNGLPEFRPYRWRGAA